MVVLTHAHFVWREYGVFQQVTVGVDHPRPMLRITIMVQDWHTALRKPIQTGAVLFCLGISDYDEKIMIAMGIRSMVCGRRTSQQDQAKDFRWCLKSVCKRLREKIEFFPSHN